MRETTRPKSGRRGHEPQCENGDLSDAGLVRALAQGHQDALAVAYARHGPFVHGLAGRLCEPRQAEDVTRAVFVSLWHSPANFHPATDSLRDLLLADTHRRAVDLLRADAGRIAWEAGMPADLLEQMVLARSTNGTIRRLLAELPKAERQIITLAYFGGYTRRQVAALLHMPEQTANACLRTGMAHLHAAMTHQGGATPPQGTAEDAPQPATDHVHGDIAAR
jgi:RNA polymerase sigma factor (sigma-70 family)